METSNRLMNVLIMQLYPLINTYEKLDDVITQNYIRYRGLSDIKSYVFEVKEFKYDIKWMILRAKKKLVIHNTWHHRNVYKNQTVKDIALYRSPIKYFNYVPWLTLMVKLY